MRNLNGFLCVLMACMCLLLVSCGGGTSSKEKVITLSEPEIAGDLSKYLEIVGNEFEIKEFEGRAYPGIKVTFKRTDTEFPYNMDMVYHTSVFIEEEKTQVSLGAEFYDEKGAPIHIISPKSPGYFDGSLVDLIKLSPGSVGTYTFFIHDDDNDVENIADIKTFKITSIIDGKDRNLITSTSNGSKVNNEWEATLDEFEKYADNYLKLLKKAKSGDMNAVAEYATVLENAESLETKLNGAKGELTPAQAKRFNKIAQKIMNAATSM